MLNRLKAKIKQSPFGFYFYELLKRRLYQYYNWRYNDEEFIVKLFKKANHGNKPDLRQPQSFSEKLQWLKLYYRHPDIPICSDKARAKQYVSEQGYPELIIPTLAIYDRAEDIDPDKLPDNFILKASHGSGWNIICRGNKNEIDWKRAKKTMALWLKENLYVYGREWNYKEQKPCIIAEQLLAEETLVDYKFMCFNGKIKALQMNHEINNTKYIDLYDEQCNLLTDMDTGICPHSDVPLPRPPQFEEMKKIAAKLAEPFPFVRVDLYNLNNKIYFGEMTFFPGSGFWSISPKKRDLQFGSWLKLPEKTPKVKS